MITPEMVAQLAVANLFALALLVTSIFLPKVSQGLFIFLFSWASITNIVISLRTPQVYVEYADFAQLEVYRQFIRGWFAIHVAWLVVPIAVGQMAIAFLLTRQGLPYTLGTIGATVFLTMIIPLGVGAGGSFPITAAVASWILWQNKRSAQTKSTAGSPLT